MSVPSGLNAAACASSSLVSWEKKSPLFKSQITIPAGAPPSTASGRPARTEGRYLSPSAQRRWSSVRRNRPVLTSHTSPADPHPRWPGLPMGRIATAVAPPVVALGSENHLPVAASRTGCLHPAAAGQPLPSG